MIATLIITNIIKKKLVYLTNSFQRNIRYTTPKKARFIRMFRYIQVFVIAGFIITKVDCTHNKNIFIFTLKYFIYVFRIIFYFLFLFFVFYFIYYIFNSHTQHYSYTNNQPLFDCHQHLSTHYTRSQSTNIP